MAVTNGHKGSQTVTHFHKWSQMVTNGHNWSQMVTNGHRWSQMVTNHRIARQKHADPESRICIANSKGYKRTLERDVGKNKHAVERAEPFPNFWSPPEGGSEGKKDGNVNFNFYARACFPDCSLFHCLIARRTTQRRGRLNATRC